MRALSFHLAGKVCMANAQRDFEMLTALLPLLSLVGKGERANSSYEKQGSMSLFSAPAEVKSKYSVGLRKVA